MKWWTTTLIACSLALAPQALCVEDEGVHEPETTQEQIEDQLEEIHQAEAASASQYEALRTSMFGWGLALAVGIAILAAVFGSNDNSAAHQ